MKYTVEWLEVKSPEWKIATLSDENGKHIVDVSINKVNKKGIEFPDFDKILPGSKIEGNLWQSPAGKTYLFAPDAPEKPKIASGGSFKGQSGMKAIIAQKAENIEKSQDRKEQSIREAAIFRDSTLLTVAQVGSDGASAEILQDAWLEWKKWLTNQMDQPF